MASNIQVALEAGCKTLLIDENSSATNLLVRDQRMQKLIKLEPMTPLISKARALYNQHGSSIVIVNRGLSSWLSVFDDVKAMDSYIRRIITNQAKVVIDQFPAIIAEGAAYGSIPERKFRVDLKGFRSPCAKTKNFIDMRSQARDPVDDPSEAESGIDLSGLDQSVEVGQARTIATLLQNIANETKDQA